MEDFLIHKDKDRRDRFRARFRSTYEFYSCLESIMVDYMNINHKINYYVKLFL
jgi:hypothetical protein